MNTVGKLNIIYLRALKRIYYIKYGKGREIYCLIISAGQKVTNCQDSKKAKVRVKGK
jgi:hypothetical protein